MTEECPICGSRDYERYPIIKQVKKNEWIDTEWFEYRCIKCNVRWRYRKEEKEDDMMECAEVSLNKMLHMVLMAKMKLMDNQVDKKAIYELLDSLEFDIKLLNDENNSIERDLE